MSNDSTNGALISSLGGLVSSVGSALPVVGGLFKKANSNALKQYQREQQINFDFDKRRALLSQQLGQENASYTDKLTRSLMSDSASLEKQGKLSAGVNPSFADGSSASPQGAAVASPSVGSAGSSPGTFNAGFQQAGMLSNGLTSMVDALVKLSKLPKEAKNIDADTQGKQANTKKTEVDTQGSALDNAGKAIQNEILDETKGVIIDQAFANLDQTFASTAKTQQEKDNLVEQANILKQNLRTVTFDADHYEQTYRKNMSKLDAEVDDLKASKSLKDAQANLTTIEARFKDMGIGISNDLLGTAIAVLASGNTALFDSAVSTLKKLFAEVTPSAKEVVDKVTDAVTDVGNRVNKSVKKVTNKAKEIRSKMPDKNGFGVDIGSNGAMP